MEEALSVLEEAEPLLKEEELAERGRDGEKWASSVYLVKGRVLEALDSRPQVLITPVPMLVLIAQIRFALIFRPRQRKLSNLHWNRMCSAWRLSRRLSNIKCSPQERSRRF